MASQPWDHTKMDAISWDRIVSSKLFRFSVGPKKREFTLHAALVASQSAALNALVNNRNFAEAHYGHVDLQYVDEATFICFAQYAYTGDYDCSHEPQGTLIDNVDEDTSAGGGKRQRHRHSQRPNKKESRLWGRFKKAADAPGPVAFTAKKNEDGKEDYTDVFLCHARLYVFADCYSIPKLMRLSLYKLGHTLAVFELFDERVGDIVKLLEYAFANPTPDELRSLLVLWTACRVETLKNSDDFKALLTAYNELSTALIESLVERLDVPHNQHDDGYYYY